MTCTDYPGEPLTPLALVSKKGTWGQGTGSLAHDNVTPTQNAKRMEDGPPSLS